MDNTVVGRGDGQHCGGQGDGGWTTLRWAGEMDNTAVGRGDGQHCGGQGDGQHCGGQGDGQHCGEQGKYRMYKVKERTFLPLPRMSST